MEVEEELTTDQKLDEMEVLLIGNLYTKVKEGESLSTIELQMLQRWLKSRDPVGKPKRPSESSEPSVLKGVPLPFLSQPCTLEGTIDALADR